VITGSGNKYMGTVRLDERNTNNQVWWCERRQEYHWQLIWEDGGPYGTHIASGAAPTREKARADVVRTMIFIEDVWPRVEYFENNL
jgi:hypothetical protein